MKSAFMIQRPKKIYIHTDTPELRGKYWEQLLQIPGFKDVLEIKKVSAPSQVFGVEFFWNAHKADVLRDHVEMFVCFFHEFSMFMTVNWKLIGKCKTQILHLSYNLSCQPK